MAGAAAEKNTMMRFALALAALLGVSACAPSAGKPAATGEAISRASPISHGVVVSRRPIGAVASTGTLAGGKDVRGSILGAVGGGLPGGADPASPPVFEFIVREDNGQTVSVVQADEGQLRPGERVVLSMGGRTRLSRAAD
jgi:outer membrane lipoprotein SlyB